jgi:ribosome maturation factor RimP
MLTSDQLRPRLEQLARRAAEPVGVEVAWIEFKPEGPSWFFRVFIDCESGVGLEECEKVSERLGVLLDVEDPIESSYTLEVSTPGLDRPLWNKQDYERFVGKLVRIKTCERIADQALFKGRLVGVEDDQILLDERGESRRIPLASVESGRLEVELFRPRPEHSGSRKGRRSRSKARKRS